MSSIKTLLFLLLAFTAAAQNPLADVKLKTHQTNSGAITTIDSVGKVWKNRRDIYPVHGTVYDFALEDDTARYQHNPPNTRLRGRTTYYDPAIGFPNQPPPPVETSTEINDNNAAIAYSAGWNYSSGTANWLQKFPTKDVHTTTTRGSSFTYNFTGTKISVASELCDNHGVARIQVLKGTTVIQTANVDMYKPTGTATNPATQNNACPNGQRAIIFTSNEFPKDNYSVRVELFSTDTAPVPDRDSMVFDNFIVYTK
jgi:hypothetical protein